MASKSKVKFTVTSTVESPDGKDEVFEAGKTYELGEASAHRWVRRGVAEYVTANRNRSESNDSTSGGTGQSK